MLFVERNYMHNCHFILLNNYSFSVMPAKIAFFSIISFKRNYIFVLYLLYNMQISPPERKIAGRINQ